MESINKLPRDASLDDIMERIYFIHKIEVGLRQSEEGELAEHEEVLKNIEEW